MWWSRMEWRDYLCQRIHLRQEQRLLLAMCAGNGIASYLEDLKLCFHADQPSSRHRAVVVRSQLERSRVWRDEFQWRPWEGVYMVRQELHW